VDSDVARCEHLAIRPLAASSKEGIMRRAFTILGLVATMLLWQPGPVSATAPTISSFHDEGTNVPVEDCGAFVVLLSFSHDETITTYYDKSGVAIREQIRFNFSATLANSVTGETVGENGAYTITIDLARGETSTVGLILLMRLQGVGVVTLELGQATFAGVRIGVTSTPGILDGGSLVCSILS
jgi:hypothetical protein